ncbi:hypothetical protein [Treponema zioleckii]|uniref:hypothetical protein n=1 Tax=Treponema zioleckii TaxID=331680 RepID=UPI00168B3E8D|nr:hypothetical protein [Treponema zioleckii]
MKKAKILFFMVALLSLTGMAFFSSCSSDEDLTLYAVWKLGTILNNKSVSVTKKSETTIGTFTLLKSENLKFKVSNADGYLTYFIKNSKGEELYKSDK